MTGYGAWRRTSGNWKGITSAMVSRAFVLAYRIMRKIIEENGNNAWLCHGTSHCCVRRDFVDTYDGIQPCQVYVPTVAVKLDNTEGFSIEF